MRKISSASHICHAVAKQIFENLDLCLSRNEISDFTKVSVASKQVPLTLNSVIKLLSRIFSLSRARRPVTALMQSCENGKRVPPKKKLVSRQSVKKELTRSRGHPLDADPPEGKHRRVMINVKERELIVLLADDEEESVGELQHLREVVPPDCVDDLQSDGTGS